jgi:hypothetical protein
MATKRKPTKIEDSPPDFTEPMNARPTEPVVEVVETEDMFDFVDDHNEMMEALELHFHMMICPDHTPEERKVAAYKASAAFRRYAISIEDGIEDGIEDDDRINAPTSYAVN